MKIEKNTVVLGLDEYNRLMEMKKAITNKNSVIVVNYLESVDYIYTESEFIKELVRNNNIMITRASKLLFPEKKKLSPYEIEKLNWWKFRLWKLGKLKIE